MEIQSLYFDSPEELPRLFAEAWNRRDAAGIAGLFHEQAEFVNVVGLWWHKREDIFEAHAYGLETIFSNSELKTGRIKVTFLADTAAMVHCRMTLTGQNEHSGINKPGRRQNIFSFTVIKENSGWICKSAHNTDVVPGKETNIIDENGELTAVDYRN
ncbi:MAG: SgcJ/EcaC family oxidoreductase [Cyclobacteriaceae bacterium]